MFRLADNVPEVYVQKSRDFQLFTRLYDSVFNGVKYSTDALQLTLNTKECNQSLLELLKTKLGLFSDVTLTDHELRCVLQAFPTLIRHKGSWQGVDDILNLFQRINLNHGDRGHVNKETANSGVKETTDNGKEKIQEPYQIVLEFNQPLNNDKLLMELLRYVLPTGYTVVYTVAETSTANTTITLRDNVRCVVTDKSHLAEAAQVKGAEISSDTDVGDLIDTYYNTTGLTHILENE